MYLSDFPVENPIGADRVTWFAREQRRMWTENRQEAKAQPISNRNGALFWLVQMPA
jgi:hypothetical protein